VKKILRELVDARVDGIIVDLRDNSGGALQEVNSLTGLFIKEGPIVQVRYANGGTNVLKDQDPEIVYSGPLAVVVNRMSASASEIFAGAIQDYHRGIIIGEQTYGKGTVQTLYALSKGQLKTTMAKFYRVSGESTQHKGVIPDISYPSFYDMDEVGESALPEALPWDQIEGVPCIFFSDIEKVMARLQDGHKKRIVSDPDYTYLIESIEHLKKLREKKEIFLSEATRTKEKNEVEKWRLEIENKRRKALNLEPLDKLSDNATAMAPDRFHNSDNETDEKDHMLVESGHILLDLASFLKQE
jgi:carboxyl-terminal processing protease